MNPTISMKVLFLINQTIIPDGYLTENLHLISCPLQYSPTLKPLMSFFYFSINSFLALFANTLKLLKELFLSFKKKSTKILRNHQSSPMVLTRTIMLLDVSIFLVYFLLGMSMSQVRIG